MHALAVLATTATPSPTPTSFDPDQVTPGPWGFIAVAFLAVAVIVLVWDMLRRIRRARYREEVNALLDAEEAHAEETRSAPDARTDERPEDPERPA